MGLNIKFIAVIICTAFISGCATQLLLDKNGGVAGELLSEIRSSSRAEQKTHYSSEATMVTQITGIADMSLPEDQQNYVEANSAKVAPGHYSVRVQCVFSFYPLFMANIYQVDIYAEKNRVYAIQCLGNLRSGRIDVREYHRSGA